MKRIINFVLDVLFVVICNVSRCGFKHLDDAYQEELPASPKEVRKTLMYKRLKRFIKISLLFKDFDLILDLYKCLPASAGRCIWNILRDETRYVLFYKDKFNFNYSFVLDNGVKCKFFELVLGKWTKGKFVELASIETIIEDDDEEGGETMEKYLLLVSANYNNFVVGEADTLEKAYKVLAELPEHIVVSESNGFDTDDYYVFKRNVVIVKSK